jgi:hypothetical protein
MGYNTLSVRRTRYYARLLGIPFERIITRGGSGHTFHFRTVDHVHGVFWFEEGDWHSVDKDNLTLWGHWTTCRERFPEDFEGYPPWNYIGHRGSDWIENGV